MPNLTHWKSVVLMALMAVVLSSCSVQKIAVKQTGGLIEKGMPAFFQESDLEIAKAALASNIKLLETLLATAPKDRTLLLTTSQALAAYAFGFVEADYERLRFTDPEAAAIAKERASDLFYRSYAYARRSLATQHPKLEAALDLPLEEFKAELEKVTSVRSVPSVFWTGFSWGGYINLNREDLAAVANLVKVEHMMDRVVELDEDFFNAGAHMFLASYYGSRPKMFGGDPKKSTSHFDQADQLNDNRLLMIKVMRAQHLMVQEQDREGFDKLIHEVLQADDNIYPEQRLMNELAKMRAGILKENETELF